MARKKQSPESETPLEGNNRKRAGFRTVRTMTQEVTSISKLCDESPDGEVVIQCVSELTEGELPSKFSKTGKAAVIVVDVVVVESGAEYTLACNAVLASSLKRAGSPLKGRFFAVSVGAPVDGKRYRNTSVEELEEE